MQYPYEVLVFCTKRIFVCQDITNHVGVRKKDEDLVIVDMHVGE